MSTLSFGKKLTRLIPDLMKEAYDLRNVGSSKFQITFSNISTANRAVSLLENKFTNFCHDEQWIAFIPNYKVTKLVIVKGIDSWDDNDNDESEETFLKNIRPSPQEGNLEWTPPISLKRITKKTPSFTSYKDNPPPPSSSPIPQTSQQTQYTILPSKQISILLLFHMDRYPSRLYILAKGSTSNHIFKK